MSLQEIALRLLYEAQLLANPGLFATPRTGFERQIRSIKFQLGDNLAVH